MKRTRQGTLFDFVKKARPQSQLPKNAADTKSTPLTPDPTSSPDVSPLDSSRSRPGDLNKTPESTKNTPPGGEREPHETSESASQAAIGFKSAEAEAPAAALPAALESLSPAQKELLEDEIANIGGSWLEELALEIKKPYFLELKRFLKNQRDAKKTIFPPIPDIYSWSKLCDLGTVKVVILGQDPYHNFNQAHGLAFSVNPPTAIPPSLRNIYKELENCYPDFQKPKHGLLTPWARQGVLLLNACLTVEAHKANSHANKGWETFTERVLQIVSENPKVVFMAWGSPAQKRIAKINPSSRHLVLKSVHPSPLSASRGWFGSKHFLTANQWLKQNGLEEIDWQV